MTWRQDPATGVWLRHDGSMSPFRPPDWNEPGETPEEVAEQMIKSAREQALDSIGDFEDLLRKYGA